MAGVVVTNRAQWELGLACEERAAHYWSIVEELSVVIQWEEVCPVRAKPPLVELLPISKICVRKWLR